MLVFLNLFNSTVPDMAVFTATFYGEKEAILLNFIENHLLGQDGGIKTNTLQKAGNYDTLSESIGLLMSYCILRDRKDLFDREFKFLKEKMLTDRNFIKWRAGDNVAYCNAAVDDLRIARALMDGYDKWGEKKYIDTAGFIQAGIFEKQVDGYSLHEFYDWKSNKSKALIPLCYLDLYTINRLGEFNRNWSRIADAGLNVINGGRISSTSPFFNKYFDYKTGKYSKDEEYSKNKGICTMYSLYTVIHQAEVNEDTGFFMEWLKKEVDSGKLYGWYNPDTSKPSGTMESTAVYALAAVYAKKTGEVDLYHKLLDKMLQFMVLDKGSQYYGGFGCVETGEFFSFDNLTALWALALER